MKKQERDMPKGVALMMTSEEADTILHALYWPLRDEQIQRAMFPNHQQRHTFVTAYCRLKKAFQEEAPVGAIYGRC